MWTVEELKNYEEVKIAWKKMELEMEKFLQEDQK